MVWFTVQAKTTLVEHIPTTINEDPTILKKVIYICQEKGTVETVEGKEIMFYYRRNTETEFLGVIVRVFSNLFTVTPTNG